MSLAVLPNDVLGIIVRLLNIRSIINTRCVCRLFYEILKTVIMPEEVTLRLSSFFEKSDDTSVSGISRIEITGGKSQNEFVIFSQVPFNQRSPFTIPEKCSPFIIPEISAAIESNDKGDIIFRRSTYQTIMKARIVSGYYDPELHMSDTWGGETSFEYIISI